MKTLVTGMMLAAAALLGCSKEADRGSAGRGDGKIRITYVPKNSGNPYFDGIVQGFEQAARDLGFDFLTTAPARGEATAQIPILKDQIQQGVSVIAISPNSPDALNAVFDDARARGIKLLVVNSDIPGQESHRDAAVLPTDFDAVGPAQVELMGSLIDYQGDFAILSATTDAPDQNYWIAGMKRALAEPKYARMKLVEIVYGDDDPLKSLTECEGLLTKYPDLRGILAPTSVGLQAAAKGVESAGVYPGGPHARGKGVAVTGLGAPNIMRRYVQDGIVKAFALWDPRAEGRLAGHLAYALATGRVKAESGAELDVPVLGARKLGKNAVVITGPPLVFTRDNIEQYQF
jgi:rhamnose transport system substrate-binding protein